MSRLDAVGFERTDEGMGFEEVQLHDVAGQGEQAFEIAQSPGAVVGGEARGFFQPGGGMLFSQLQQAEHHAQALRAAGGMHAFGPGAGERADQPATIQQVIDAALDEVALAAVQMCRIGGELSRLGQRGPLRGCSGGAARAMIQNPSLQEPRNFPTGSSARCIRAQVSWRA